LSGKLSELLLDPSSRMFDVLRPEPVRTLLEEHRSRRQDNHKLLFSLVLLEQWIRSAEGARPGKTVGA
jgi:asparagine synthase (glutamine-hydrolysing)